MIPKLRTESVGSMRASPICKYICGSFLRFCFRLALTCCKSSNILNISNTQLQLNLFSGVHPEAEKVKPALCSIQRPKFLGSLIHHASRSCRNRYRQLDRTAPQGRPGLESVYGIRRPLIMCSSNHNNNWIPLTDACCTYVRHLTISVSCS